MMPGATCFGPSSASRLQSLMSRKKILVVDDSLVILKINDNYSNTLLGGLILLAIVVDRARERLDAAEPRGAA